MLMLLLTTVCMYIMLQPILNELPVGVGTRGRGVASRGGCDSTSSSVPPEPHTTIDITLPDSGESTSLSDSASRHVLLYLTRKYILANGYNNQLKLKLKL